MHRKILIVDDDPGVCDSLGMIFRLEGYCVKKTTDSKEAEILIRKNTYDVCVFDYKMDGLNGINLLKITKDVNPQCHVFIISGALSIEELCQEEIKSGTSAVIISKPFEAEMLLQKIRDVV